MGNRFHLESSHYVPERVLRKIDETTYSMMEHGFYQFYLSLAEFKEKFVQRVEQMHLDDDFSALSMDQLQRPLKILFCLWGLAAVILVLEIIVSKWKHHNRIHRAQPDETVKRIYCVVL